MSFVADFAAAHPADTLLLVLALAPLWQGLTFPTPARARQRGGRAAHRHPSAAAPRGACSDCGGRAPVPFAVGVLAVAAEGCAITSACSSCGCPLTARVLPVAERAQVALAV